MSVQVRKIAYDSEDFKRFLAFREVLYPKNSPIHLLKEDFNEPCLHQIFLLEEAGEIIARAVLYLNSELVWNGKSTASIGNYEAFDGPEAIPFLFQAMEEEALKEGIKSLIGPMNGSTWYSYRLTENTENPFLFEPVHPAYYHQHFLNHGFERIAEYCSSKVSEIPEDDGYFARLRMHFERELGIKFRTIDLDKYEQELEAIFPFLECSFRNNFLFTAIAKEEFIAKYLQVKPIINAAYTYLAEDPEGNIIGCIFCVDDLFPLQEKTLIVKTIARDPQTKYEKLGQVLGSIIYPKAKSEGYDSIIHALMEKTAHSSPISLKFAGKPINNYFLYGKILKEA